MTEHLLNDLINVTTNVSFTENNAMAYRSTLDACLDLFFRAVPGIQEPVLIDLLEKSWSADSLLTLKLIFNIRSVREGKSDKRNFYLSMLWLMEKHPQTFLENLNVVPETGYWKDLLEIPRWSLRNSISKDVLPVRPHPKNKDDNSEWMMWVNEDIKAFGPLNAHVIQVKAWKTRLKQLLKEYEEKNDTFADALEQIACLFAEALKADLKAMEDGKNVSLAAKWVPTQNGSHDKFLKLNKRIALKLFPVDSALPEEERRQKVIASKHRLQKDVLAPLRKLIPVVEAKMSAKEWDSVQYAKVPSVSMKKNTSAFKKHDSDRFVKYLDSVKKGVAKINAAALLPHEICVQARDRDETKRQVAELQWTQYVDELAKSGLLSNTLAVCDVSGSMSGTPMEVSIAMGLLTATLSKPPFKDIVCTFSEKPEFFVVSGTTLAEKYDAIQGMKWGMNTDFKAVFDLILQRAIQNNTPAKEMIKRVIVYSDMQFDEAARGTYNLTIHQSIQNEYRAAGYEAPMIVYWNLRASAAIGLPVTKHDTGALLLSGYSGKMLKLLMAGEELNMIEMMLKAVSAELYQKLVVKDYSN